MTFDTNNDGGEGMPRFTTLIFDLDDTLTDTQGQLIAKARSESIQEMVKNGLSFSVEEALALWLTYLQNPIGGDDVFDFITRHHVNPEERTRLAGYGRDAFYHREVPKTFHAFTECGEILSRLKIKYDLFLVTTGAVDTQKQKVKITGLGNFFQSVFYVNHMKGEKKTHAFQEILARHEAPPSKVLVIGNRMDHEIREGKKLGCTTCLVKRGEHRHQEPRLAEDYPDFTIDHIREVIAKCRL